jgi:hypothetical protein
VSALSDADRRWFGCFVSARTQGDMLLAIACDGAARGQRSLLGVDAEAWLVMGDGASPLDLVPAGRHSP